MEAVKASSEQDDALRKDADQASAVITGPLYNKVVTALAKSLVLKRLPLPLSTASGGLYGLSPCQHEVRILVLDPASRSVSFSSIGRDQVKAAAFSNLVSISQLPARLPDNNLETHIKSPPLSNSISGRFNTYLLSSRYTASPDCFLRLLLTDGQV